MLGGRLEKPRLRRRFGLTLGFRRRLGRGLGRGLGLRPRPLRPSQTPKDRISRIGRAALIRTDGLTCRDDKQTGCRRRGEGRYCKRRIETSKEPASDPLELAPGAEATGQPVGAYRQEPKKSNNNSNESVAVAKQVKRPSSSSPWSASRPDDKAKYNSDTTSTPSTSPITLSHLAPQLGVELLVGVEDGAPGAPRDQDLARNKKQKAQKRSKILYKPSHRCVAAARGQFLSPKQKKQRNQERRPSPTLHPHTKT